jgi:hypothetical protein
MLRLLPKKEEKIVHFYCTTAIPCLPGAFHTFSLRSLAGRVNLR